MKVFIHILNPEEFMDKEVQVAADFSAVPSIGDVIHLGQEQLDLLNLLFNCGKSKVYRYSCWIYGGEGNHYLSFDDCIFVHSLCWKRSDGRYDCHIELNDRKDSDDIRKGKCCSYEEFDTIYKELLHYHEKNDW